MNVSEFVWHRLSDWGLKRVSGYPGDGVGGLDVALEKAKDRIEYVQVRHEEMAAFMASAHAEFTGHVGLCYATSGPGAIHLFTAGSSPLALYLAGNLGDGCAAGPPASLEKSVKSSVIVSLSARSRVCRSHLQKRASIGCSALQAAVSSLVSATPRV